MKVALTYADGTFDLRDRIMGRQAAGLGFLRALGGAGLQSVGCYSASELMAEQFTRDLAKLVANPPDVHFISFERSEQLAKFSLLYRADPSIGEDAWYRQQRSGARAYSLCGVTHTMSSKGAMAALSGLPEAPLYPWDAVVCTSRAARNITLRLIDMRMDHFRVRLGATTLTLPQLPLIPLGIHVQDFATTAETRAAARAALGLGSDDVALLFAGRLTFHAKSHPLPMFIGLERACKASGKSVALLVFGQFPNPAIEAAFREEAALFAPSIRLILLDGAVPANGPQAWAAADVFTSLSDNIQETFGLTPVEAMAAGLPCVVSDWDGYKDTVRDGIDGFRVPTFTPPAGYGNDLADRFDLGGSDYDRHIGEVSLFTAVDVGAAAEAYRRLIVSPNLRRTMGDAGRKRAVEIYDWPVIFRRYMALWEELAERRRSDPRVPGEESRARRAERPDPFDLFGTYPTTPIETGTRVRLAVGATPEAAIDRKRLKSVSYAAPVLPNDTIVTRLIGALAGHPEGMTVGDLHTACAPMPIGGVIRSLAFLAKMAVVDVLLPP